MDQRKNGSWQDDTPGPSAEACQRRIKKGSKEHLFRQGGDKANKNNKYSLVKRIISQMKKIDYILWFSYLSREEQINDKWGSKIKQIESNS